MKVFVYTLGCRVNQCESEAVAESFAKGGHEVLKSFSGADLVIVNTCTVTSKAEQKARREISANAYITAISREEHLRINRFQTGHTSQDGQ